MTIEELRKLRKAFDRHVKRFDDCIKTAPSRKHLRTYLKGQLGPLERKSVEPIALDAGTPPRTLQEFLSIHRWDHEAVGRRLRSLAMRDHADDNAVAVVDESAFEKCGPKTAGVQRQYNGRLGKIANSVVTVNLGYAASSFRCLLDSDLYLPQSWAEDRERCRQAHIPDDVVYRPKHQIALDLLNRSVEEGVHFRWLTADEAYGRHAEFRHGVAAAGLTYVVEVPSSLAGWTRAPKVPPAGFQGAKGPALTKPRVAPGEPKAREVRDLWRRGGPSWKDYRVKDTEKGPVVWRVRESRFSPRENRVPGEAVRVIVAVNVLSREVKYFLSNAPAEVPLKVLLAVAFSRWNIEKLYQEGKGEVGMHRFEVRGYPSPIRHLVLTNLSVYFLAEQTDILRGEKPGVVDLPGAPGRGGAVGAGRPAAGADETLGEIACEVRVPAAPARLGRAVARHEDPPTTPTRGHRSPKGHPVPSMEHELALYS